LQALKALTAMAKVTFVLARASVTGMIPYVNGAFPNAHDRSESFASACSLVESDSLQELEAVYLGNMFLAWSR